MYRHSPKKKGLIRLASSRLGMRFSIWRQLQRHNRCHQNDSKRQSRMCVAEEKCGPGISHGTHPALAQVIPQLWTNASKREGACWPLDESWQALQTRSRMVPESEWDGPLKDSHCLCNCGKERHKAARRPEQFRWTRKERTQPWILSVTRRAVHTARGPKKKPSDI